MLRVPKVGNSMSVVDRDCAACGKPIKVTAESFNRPGGWTRVCLRYYHMECWEASEVTE